jgi:hypothetical protein
MRLGFISLGGLVLVGAILKGTLALKVAWPHAFVGLYGLAILLSGIFSTSPFMPGVEFSSQEASLHSTMATLAGIAISVAMVSFTLTDNTPRRKAFHFSALILTMLLSVAFRTFDAVAGVFQRLL